MNAIAPSPPQEAGERTQRHLGMCAELAGLAMELARAAAARALAEWAEPETAAPPEPPTAEPPTHAAQPPTSPNPKPRRAAGTTRYKPTDPAVLFTRLAAVVRDCIALEHRLAGGAMSAPRASRAAAAPKARACHADPRRTPVLEAIRCSLAKHPDGAAIMREATASLDEHLRADPEQTVTGCQLVDRLVAEFGIELNFTKLPDKYLNALSGPAELAGNDDRNIPEQRATYPP